MGPDFLLLATPSRISLKRCFSLTGDIGRDRARSGLGVINEHIRGPADAPIAHPATHCPLIPTPLPTHPPFVYAQSTSRVYPTARIRCTPASRIPSNVALMAQPGMLLDLTGTYHDIVVERGLTDGYLIATPIAAPSSERPSDRAKQAALEHKGKCRHRRNVSRVALTQFGQRTFLPQESVPSRQ